MYKIIITIPLFITYILIFLLLNKFEFHKTQHKTLEPQSKLKVKMCKPKEKTFIQSKGWHLKIPNVSALRN